jgi:hypothetical protein
VHYYGFDAPQFLLLAWAMLTGNRLPWKSASIWSIDESGGGLDVRL